MSLEFFIDLEAEVNLSALDVFFALEIGGWRSGDVVD
jgi:hypothetical protein